ncbi:MAG: hypothetical protein ACREJC_02105 [Tepidisphaeraceae bacterium]
MAKLGVKEIREVAKEVLAKHPSGLRFTQLVSAIASEHPETNANTIFTQVSSLPKDSHGEIVKPSRGVYQLATLAESQPEQSIAPNESPVSIASEANFYDSFAVWLRDDLDEVTESVSLGGAGLKTKWGTPDVVGTYKPQARDLYRFPTEIVSGEMKTDASQSVVAFGQAVAYRLFSHKSYLAMPSSLGQDEAGRLESLCLLFGLGLVLFDIDQCAPNYRIRTRAQRFNPDVFYVNEFIQRLSSHNGEVFQRLFG